MPDLFSVLLRRWRLILLLTFAGIAAAYIACLLRPKLYLGTTTALPVNTLVNDKARLFNNNIEALYSEIGTADELDKIEGTAELDTIFLAVADAHHLSMHYELDTAAGDVLEKAALTLKRNTDISRTGYGELNIKVWDKSNAMAATLANAVMQTVNAIHERLQTENNKTILENLREAYAVKSVEWIQVQDRLVTYQSASNTPSDTVRQHNVQGLEVIGVEQQMLAEQLKQHARLIGEYELALRTAPKALLVVEQARPSPWYDKPKTSQTVMLAFFASLLFSILLAVFIESRNAHT